MTASGRLETDGLWGVIWAPFLHANWTHLTANAGFVLVLGFLMTLAGLSRFIWATAIVWIVGGFGTWLIGNIGAPKGVETNHIGASGLILGWLTFLLVFGLFTRTRRTDRHRLVVLVPLRRRLAGRAAWHCAACRGRGIYAAESPGCSPRIFCPIPSERAAPEEAPAPPPRLTT